MPIKLLSFIYIKLETYLKNSLSFKLLLFLLDYLHIGISLFLVLVIMVPQRMWDNRYNFIAAVGFLLLFYIKSAVKGKMSKLTRIFDLFLAIFVLSVILAEVFSILPFESLRFFLFYMSCFIMMGVLVLSIESRKQLMHVIEILILAIAVSGLYGTWQSIVGVPVNPAQVDQRINEGMPGRVYSTMENSNNFAVALTLFLPFFLVGFLNSEQKLKKVLYFILAIPCLVSLVMTFARGSWVGFVAAAGIIVLFKYRKLIPLFLVLAIIALPFLPQILPQSIYRRLMTFFNPEDSSVGTRMDIYRTVLPVLKDYWVTGIGLDTNVFAVIIRKYYMFANTIPAHSHDLFLQIWVETGIVGILSFLGSIAGIIKRSIKAIMDKSDPFISNILVAGVASIVGMLVTGLPDYVWFYARVMMLFWVVIGIILAALGLAARADEKAMPDEKKVAA